MPIAGTYRHVLCLINCCWEARPLPPLWAPGTRSPSCLSCDVNKPPTTLCGECNEHYCTECIDPHTCGGKPKLCKMQQCTNLLIHLIWTATLDAPDQTPIPQMSKQLLKPCPVPQCTSLYDCRWAVKVPFFLGTKGTMTCTQPHHGRQPQNRGKHLVYKRVCAHPISRHW